MESALALSGSGGVCQIPEKGRDGKVVREASRFAIPALFRNLADPPHYHLAPTRFPSAYVVA
jgi:hypothetical protein